jgi:hypothetical protein
VECRWDALASAPEATLAANRSAVSGSAAGLVHQYQDKKVPHPKFPEVDHRARLDVPDDQAKAKCPEADHRVQSDARDDRGSAKSQAAAHPVQLDARDDQDQAIQLVAARQARSDAQDAPVTAKYPEAVRDHQEQWDASGAVEQRRPRYPTHYQAE